jgi:hypothetical protein
MIARKVPYTGQFVVSDTPKIASSPLDALVYWMMKSNSEVMLNILASCLFAGVSLAAGEGFEPSLTDSESVKPRCGY